MNIDLVKSKIEEWLGTILAEKNLFLVEVKFATAKQIEVYVDSDEGIHISECAEVSRMLEKKIDESGLLPDNYILEVSSPGMSNPLKIPRQYKRRVGQVLEVVKNDGTLWIGELVQAGEEQITLREVMAQKSKTQRAKEKKEAGNRQVEAPTAKEWDLKFSEIKKATIQFKF